MINNRGMAGAGAAVAAGGMAALLALTGCALGSTSSSAAGGTTAAVGATASGLAAAPGPGPAHTISTPAQLGSYTRNPGLEKAMDVSELSKQVVAGGSARATGVLSAVYAQGNVAPGAGGNLFMFVGGHLANDDPAASIASFERAFPHTQVIQAGSLGGEAACAKDAMINGTVAMCAWFDNDTFGTLVSPTMSTAKLASILDTVRSGIEHVSQ